MFSMNSANSETKIFVITVKGFKSATSCVKFQGSYHSANKTHVRHRIFKFTPIHASVIAGSFRVSLFIRFPEFTEFLFHLRKTPMSSNKTNDAYPRVYSCSLPTWRWTWGCVCSGSTQRSWVPGRTATRWRRISPSGTAWYNCRDAGRMRRKTAQRSTSRLSAKKTTKK